MISQPPAGRGRASGALLVLLGAWGALVPFVGPYFGYAYAPDKAWAYSSGRLVLSVLPGAVVVLGGLLVLASEGAAAIGGFFAAAGGAWFAVGAEVMAVAARGGSYRPGSPAVAPGSAFGPATMRLLEHLGFYSGLGLVIVFLGALALGKAVIARLAGSGYGAPTSTVTEEHQYGQLYRAAGQRVTGAVNRSRAAAVKMLTRCCPEPDESMEWQPCRLRALSSARS